MAVVHTMRTWYKAAHPRRNQDAPMCPTRKIRKAATRHNRIHEAPEGRRRSRDAVAYPMRSQDAAKAPHDKLGRSKGAPNKELQCVSKAQEELGHNGTYPSIGAERDGIYSPAGARRWQYAPVQVRRMHQCASSRKDQDTATCCVRYCNVWESPRKSNAMETCPSRSQDNKLMT